MKFSEQIKLLRNENHLSQEQMASQLHVTRQAVSNWENDKNLPDLEIVIQIAKQFGVSLDTLILGEDDNRSEVATKLIQDEKDGKQARMNLTASVIGSFFMMADFLCLFIKANSVEYVDDAGYLHENFYLLPVGMGFALIGLAIIVISFVIFLVKRHQH
ncbi:MAG: helix-turn-helix domain-containing protein [Lactimicrobium sp.]|uniref:helix-turn-helix domain-containing protein n=1 Tax=Lactimicrobium sp. TaxID=2563780 RepID=UPI002F34F2FB